MAQDIYSADTIIIDADKQPVVPNLRELWHFRELMLFMIWREWSVRYKQTALGVGWVVLQPIATTIIFSVIFGLFLDVSSQGIPFPVFFLCGLIPWRYFSDAVGRASASLIMNAHLVDKVYFPRLILPGASIITPLADFVFSMIILIITILLFQLNPFSLRLLVLPVLLLLTIIIAAAVGVWFAAMNVRYRDVGQFLPFILQVWMYASPILYPIDYVLAKLPDWAVQLYRLNPMVGIVEGFRWALLDAPAPDWSLAAVSMIPVVLALAVGVLYFHRMERSFGDII